MAKKTSQKKDSNVNNQKQYTEEDLKNVDKSQAKKIRKEMKKAEKNEMKKLKKKMKEDSKNKKSLKKKSKEKHNEDGSKEKKKGKLRQAYADYKHEKQLQQEESLNAINQQFPDRDFLVDDYPFTFEPSYWEHNGLHHALLQFYVRPGSNKELSHEDVIKFIPISTLENTSIHIINDDNIIKGDTKKLIIKRNAAGNKGVLEDTDKTESDKHEDTKSDKDQRQSQFDDYADYEDIIDTSDPIVVFRWTLLVIGHTREEVEMQVELINQDLDKNRDGAQWDSMPGEQQERLQNLFLTIPQDQNELTATNYNYSGLDLAINSGLNDPEGLPLGSNFLSLYRSNVYFDFEHSTQRQAIVTIPRNSNAIPLYASPPEDGEDAEFRDLSSSSLIAQYAANQYNMYGHRVHHIVLNDFNYFESGVYHRQPTVKDIFDRYDVMNLTVNPLQGFGPVEDAARIYSSLRLKNRNLFNILLDFEMTQSQSALVSEALSAFYNDRDYWKPKFVNRPRLSRITNIKDPETYETLIGFLDFFDTLSKRYMDQNRENKADDVDTLKGTLESALDEYTNILAKPTTIKESDSMQVYYDFGRINNLKLKHIQFINLLDFIISQADKEDVIIIHGFDEILSKVADMTIESIQEAQKKGIRFLFCFDRVESRETAQGKLNDIFEMKKKFYTDLDTDVDWSLVGRLMPEELPKFRDALNQHLGRTIESCLLHKAEDLAMIHRAYGSVNDFVNLQFII